MSRAYYAHCMAIYHTAQEDRDISLLTKLGFDVVNPSVDPHRDRDMAYYCRLAMSCDLVAFRGLPDGKIPAGVAKEIQAALEVGRPVIELPSGISRRCLTVNQTIETLRELGQR